MSDTFQFIERARLLLDQGRVNDAVKQLKNALQQPKNKNKRKTTQLGRKIY